MTSTEQNAPSNARQAAVAAANWWADKVFGNERGSSGSGDIDVMSILAGIGEPAPAAKRDEFVVALARRVEAFLVHYPDDKYGMTLSTDYSAEGSLATVGREVGVGGFPMKTMMHVCEEYVTASLGYGAQTRIVWHVEGWERPMCHQGQWDLSTPRGGRLPFKCGLPRWHDEREHDFSIPVALCAGTLRGEPCNRPESDEYHNMDDAWSGAHHPFTTTEEKA